MFWALIANMNEENITTIHMDTFTSLPEDLSKLERIDRLEMQRTTIQAQFTYENRVKTRIGKKLIYENQQEAANEVIAAYEKGAVWATIVAQPGTGKTGTALSVMRQVGQHSDDNVCVAVEDTFLCTGMSDIDWEHQFSLSVLPIFRDNIYHRGKLAKQATRLAGIRTGLIITDECHIACSDGMVVHKTLHAAGLLDISELERRNMRMLDISATPEAVLHDLKKWGNRAAMVVIKPGPLYKGFRAMLDENRIRDAPVFRTYEEVVSFLKTMDDRFRTTSKKYFIMRVFSTKVRDTEYRTWIERASITLGWEHPWNHDSNDRKDDIDNRMKNAPAKHTIILVKGFWRASKRLERTHIGMTYENKPKTRDTTSTAQGLAARLCDNYEYYGDQLNPDLRPLIYCDKGAIEQYLNWFENDCDYGKVDYDAPRIRSRASDGRVIARASKVHHSGVKGLEEVSDDDENTNGNYLLSPSFDSITAAKDWASTNLLYASYPMNLHYQSCTRTPCCTDPTGEKLYYRYRSEMKRIMTESEFRADTSGRGIRLDTGGHAGSQAACIMPVCIDVVAGANTAGRIWPVTVGDAGMKHIVVFKKSFLRSPNGGAGRE